MPDTLREGYFALHYTKESLLFAESFMYPINGADFLVTLPASQGSADIPMLKDAMAAYSHTMNGDEHEGEYFLLSRFSEDKMTHQVDPTKRRFHRTKDEWSVRRAEMMVSKSGMVSGEDVQRWQASKLSGEQGPSRA